jgi:bifunctional non-homologous end joining protein LigD
MAALEVATAVKRQRRRDSDSKPRYPIPVFRPFQLCALVDEVPKGKDWLFELKFDGYRAQAAISGPQVVVYTRNGHDWTQQFRVIVPALSSLTKGSALIDGEIVAIDSEGRTNFSMLKTGIAAGMPLKFYAFDLLELNGEDLSRLPLRERKSRLEALLGEREPQDAVQYSAHVAEGGPLFDAACAGGHEGIIAKRSDRHYIGDRTAEWLKIKCIKRQEFVVGGYRPSDSGRGMASLILGTYEAGKLVYRGRVGTGFTESMREKILARLERRRLDNPPFAAVPRDIARRGRWVKPELVAEVSYSEITPDGSLRHPSFQGMREDKRADQVVMEVPKKSAAAVPAASLDPELGTEIATALGVKLTHPDKIMYPGTKVTKATLAAYYAAVLDKMLPHIEDRPLSLVRDTDGDLKQTFFQKHKLPGMPKTIHDGHLEKMSGKESRILWVDDLAGLIGGVQMNVLEFHVWGSLRQQPDLPHRIIFDIDPDEGLDFGDVKHAATDIRGILEAIGLQSWPLLSGGKGVHVVVPLVPEADWDQVKDFCQDFAELLARTDPSRFVANMSKARRRGRMFLDYLRNGQGSTAVCPWSTRARPGATCAVPVTWEELPGIERASAFDVFAAAARAQGPDAWAGYWDVEQTLTERMGKAIQR